MIEDEPVKEGHDDAAVHEASDHELAALEEPVVAAVAAAAPVPLPAVDGMLDKPLFDLGVDGPEVTRTTKSI